VANIIAFESTAGKLAHASDKPGAMLDHFFRMVVDKDTRMLDPTCGGGSALRAARRAHAKEVVGIEQDPTFARTAQTLWLLED
jgi:predicted O-methyltransferase YrrM